MSSADEADAAFALLDQVRSILGDSNGRVSSLLQRLHSALEGRRDAVDSLRLALQRQTDAQERREAVLAEQISNLNAQVRRADREAARAALQQQQAAPAPTSSSSSALTAGDSALLAEAQSELLRVRKMARVDRDEQQRRHEAELDALKRAAAEREQALELRLAQATQKSAPSGKKSVRFPSSGASSTRTADADAGADADTDADADASNSDAADDAPAAASHMCAQHSKAFVHFCSQCQVLACDACIQSPQSPHLRHAHAVTGLLLAAAATSSRIDAALATVLHRTDMVEEAMQFHLTTQTRLDAVQGATDEAIEDYFAVFQRALDTERAAAWEANAAVYEPTLKRCATRVGDYHRALHVMRSASVAVQQQFEAERAADPYATIGGGSGGNADKPKGKAAAPATDAQLTNAERTAATARVQRLQQLYARLDNLLRRFPEPKPLRAEAPIVTLLGGASIPFAREALTASAAQRTFIACFSATETRPECAQLGLTGNVGSAASASASASTSASGSTIVSATSTVTVGERVTVAVQLRDMTGAPFAQSGWKWRVELTSDTLNAGPAKSAAVGLVAATPAGPSSSSAAVTISDLGDGLYSFAFVAAATGRWRLALIEDERGCALPPISFSVASTVPMAAAASALNLGLQSASQPQPQPQPSPSTSVPSAVTAPVAKTIAARATSNAATASSIGNTNANTNTSSSSSSGAGLVSFANRALPSVRVSAAPSVPVATTASSVGESSGSPRRTMSPAATQPHAAAVSAPTAVASVPPPAVSAPATISAFSAAAPSAAPVRPAIPIQRPSAAAAAATVFKVAGAGSGFSQSSSAAVRVGFTATSRRHSDSLSSHSDLASASASSSAPAAAPLDDHTHASTDHSSSSLALASAPAPAPAECDLRFASTFGTLGDAAMQFNSPMGVAFSSSSAVMAADTGLLFVADSGNHRVQCILYPPRGAARLLWTHGTTGEAGDDVRHLNTPRSIGLSLDEQWLFVIDAYNHRCCVLRAADGLRMGAFGVKGAAAGCFNSPWAVCAAGASHPRRVWVTDSNNHRALAFDVAVSANGADREVDARCVAQIDTISGEAAPASVFSRAVAQFNTPRGVACAGDLLFVADSKNRRVQVFDQSQAFQAAASSASSSSSAWTAIHSIGGQPGEPSPFGAPRGLAIDTDRGLLLVCDTDARSVTAFDAAPPFASRGRLHAPPASLALKAPKFAAFDAATGAAYAADFGEHRVVTWTLP